MLLAFILRGRPAEKGYLLRQGSHRDVIERRKTSRDLNASPYQNHLRTR